MVRPRRFSSEPTFAARSASDGSWPSSRRSVSRAASSSRRWRRTPRGHASRRSASIIAPRTRRSANVSNLMPRALVEAVGGVDQAHDPVLHQVADVDRVRHRRGEAAREGFDKREPGDDAVAFVGGNRMGLHECFSSASADAISALSDEPRPVATTVPELDTRGHRAVPGQAPSCVSCMRYKDVSVFLSPRWPAAERCGRRPARSQNVDDLTVCGCQIL